MAPEANLSMLLGLMDHFGVQKAILVGNSVGAALSMQFALQYPQRVEALILVDPAVYESGGPAWVNLLGKTPQMQHLGPLFVRSIQKIGLDLIRTAWHDPSRITPATWDGYIRPLRVDNWDRALWDFTLASHATGLVQHLKDFSVPILVITGDDDRIVPTAEIGQVGRGVAGCKISHHSAGRTRAARGTTHGVYAGAGRICENPALEADLYVGPWTKALKSVHYWRNHVQRRPQYPCSRF